MIQRWWPVVWNCKGQQGRLPKDQPTIYVCLVEGKRRIYFATKNPLLKMSTVITRHLVCSATILHRLGFIISHVPTTTTGGAGAYLLVGVVPLADLSVGKKGHGPPN
jgi:hypothetical protein